MIEIIQHFLLQNSTILHIKTSVVGTLGCTVFIQEIFLFIHEQIYTCMNRHTPIHFTLHTRTHYYIAMHTLHVKKSHSDCSQSLIKNHPNRLLCCLLLLYHVFVHFVYYFMQFRTRKSAVICRRSAINYRNKPYIAKKCMLSAVRTT